MMAVLFTSLPTQFKWFRVKPVSFPVTILLLLNTAQPFEELAWQGHTQEAGVVMMIIALAFSTNFNSKPLKQQK